MGERHSACECAALPQLVLSGSIARRPQTLGNPEMQKPVISHPTARGEVRFARGVERLEFSVIGDAVNVAARVESVTRQTGDLVLIAGRTREVLTHSEIELVERPGLALKGETRPVEIYAPVRAAAPPGAEA
jgi:class 3 adenylate cyclase